MAVAPVVAEAPRRSFLYTRAGVWTVRVLTAVLILAAWQWYADGLEQALFAPPTRVADALWRQVVVDKSIWEPLGSSMTALSLGFLAAIAVGIPLGVLMGRWRVIENVLDPYVMFLYALPHVSFVPIMVIWFGFELKFRIIYVVFSAVWPVIINTMTGVKSIDPELLAIGRSFCARERQMLRTIVLPAAAPFMVVGARQAFSAAWVGVVVSEILSTQSGLGGLIMTFANYFQTADMLVPVLFIMAIAVIIQAFTGFLQTRLTPWSDSAH